MAHDAAADTASSTTLPPGFNLGRYRIEAVLGVGGFGVTYRALDPESGETFAIKEFFPAEFARRNPDGVSLSPLMGRNAPSLEGEESPYQWGLARFLQEAQVLAKLDHPHVVKIREYFSAHGTAYIVMDYEEGCTLETLLQEDRLSEDDILGMLEDILPALTEVHRQGFLHRDIKPANLYVRSRDGGVMLIDFGSARESMRHRRQDMTVMVSQGYSPPEQYSSEGKDLGPWSDLYALGAVLFHCLTRQTPPEAPTRVLRDTVISRLKICTGYSPTLKKAIVRAMALQPRERYQSVDAFQADLRPMGQGLIGQLDLVQNTAEDGHNVEHIAITGLGYDLDPKTLAPRLAELFSLTIHRAKALIGDMTQTGNELVVARNVPYGKAKIVKQKLNEAGFEVNLHLSLSLVPIEDATKFVVCPACGFSQPKALDGYDVCKSCGVTHQRYRRILAVKRRLGQEENPDLVQADAAQVEPALEDQGAMAALWRRTWGRWNTGQRAAASVLAAVLLIAPPGMYFWHFFPDDQDGGAGTSTRVTDGDVTQLVNWQRVGSGQQTSWLADTADFPESVTVVAGGGLELNTGARSSARTSAQALATIAAGGAPPGGAPRGGAPPPHGGTHRAGGRGGGWGITTVW
ncbi:MAG: serine/threonine protein kinase, partial [Candidatus Competibacterales bacterium]